MIRIQGYKEGILAFFLLITIFFPTSLFAQLDTGGITGTVTDATGAVVPGAKVTLTNTDTSVAQTMQSTSTGTYDFTGIRPGTYSLRAEAPGFQAFVDDGVLIHVQQILTVDVHFVTGQVTQEVTVTASAPLLQAESAAVGQTVTTQAVNDLPLETRDWASLAQLSAGVNTATVGNPSSDSGQTSSAFFSVNGIDTWQNDFRLNGINDNIEMYGGASVLNNAAITPPPDAVQEFKLQSGNADAEFGHSTGAVVNAAIKSGTNSFHGDAWEFWRSDVLNANQYFSGGKRKPEYRQNLFGGTLGGPIRKDKTFFFADYQGGRYITPSPQTDTVPTQNMINSFQSFLSSGTAINLQDLITYNSGTATDELGRVIPHGTILDPATTRGPFTAGQLDPVSGLTFPLTPPPGDPTCPCYVRDPFYTGGSIAGITTFVGKTSQLNILPANRIDPNAVKLLGVYPGPTVPNALANNFLYTPKEPENTNSYDIRIDENLSSRDVLFGVFDRSYISETVPSTLPGVAVGEGGGRHDSFPAYAWAVGYNHIFTPTLINELHVGMVHADKLQESNYGDTFGIPAQYGIQGIPQVANNGGLPPITINGLTHIGVGNFTPTLQYVYSVEVADNLTKEFGSHTFKMGLQLDNIYGNISQPPQGRGDLNFNGQYTDIPNQNSNLTGIGDLLLIPIPSTVGGPNDVGGMSSYSGSNIAATVDRRWYIGSYFQDDWKLNPRLTLNLGLRWDYFQPYAEINGRQANFIPVGGNGATGTYYMSNKGCAVPRSTSFNTLLTSSNITLDCVGGLTLGDAQKTNFAPRLGFAYRLSNNLVVRGGYGIAYGALGNLGYGGTLGTNYPFVYTSTFNSPDSYQPLLLGNGQPATMETGFTTISLSDPTINTGQGLNMYGRQYNFQTPYVQTFNLTVEDQFTNHDAVQVGYVGTFGVHLDNLGYNNSPSEILPTSVNQQLYIPFQSFARNSTYETTNANSNYNSLQTTYQHQLGNGLTLLFNYTYSRCMSDQHTQASQNQLYRAEWLPGFGIHADYALCDIDAMHLVHFSGTYNIPFGRGLRYMKNASSVVDSFLGGWAVNFIYTYQSGQPTTVTCATATSEFGCFANLVSGQDPYAGPHNHTEWLNPAAFATPPAATTIGQTSYAPLGGGGQQVYGPGFNNLDASIFKNFAIRESIYLQFRAESFNFTNTPQFAQPGNLSSYLNVKNGFSAITSTRAPSRRFQLALKLLF